MRFQVAVMLAVLSCTARVRAQFPNAAPAPSPPPPQAPVSQQTQTPIAIAQHTERSLPTQVDDQFQLTLSAGATLNGGNTEAYAANGGARMLWVNHPHQLSMEALATLGYAKNQTTDEIDQTSSNQIGRLRYDLFLSRMDALFLAIAPRRDTFAGLNLRLQNQIGYLRNIFFRDETHRLWTELGYDLTFDEFADVPTTTVVTNPTDPRFPAPGPNETITVTTTTYNDEGHAVVHSGRVFFGYHNTLFTQANVNLGVETLFDIKEKKNVRVNGVGEFTSSLSQRFKLGVQFRIMFDNEPVVGVKKKYDTITALQLIYTFDTKTVEPEPVCEPCEAAAVTATAVAVCEAREVTEPEPPVEAPPPEEPLPP